MLPYEKYPQYVTEQAKVVRYAHCFQLVFELVSMPKAFDLFDRCRRQLKHAVTFDLLSAIRHFPVYPLKSHFDTRLAASASKVVNLRDVILYVRGRNNKSNLNPEIDL